MNLIRSIINFFGFNDAIVDGIGERGMRDSSIIDIMRCMICMTRL